MVRSEDLNKVSKQLLDEIPKLLPGEIKTFQALWGVKIHDAQEESKVTLSFGKRRFRLKDQIFDPHAKKTVDIGVPNIIRNGIVEEYVEFAPGETEPQFGGRFSLSGDNPEHIEIFQFFMLSNFVKNNKHRAKNSTPVLELLGVVEKINEAGAAFVEVKKKELQPA